MELAIDTSTGTAGVALSRRGVVVEERIWTAGRNHTVELMPEVVALLGRNGTKATELDAIFVATGPGSFSGLRVGISAAKGLALGTAATLIGIGTMWIEAAPFAHEGVPVRPILDAGRGELSVGHFSLSEHGLDELAPMVVLTAEALAQVTLEPTFFCGEHLPMARDHLAETLGTLVSFPEPGEPRRPRYLCALGWERLQQGHHAGAEDVVPTYARPPSISKPNPTKAAKL